MPFWDVKNCTHRSQFYNQCFLYFLHICAIYLDAFNLFHFKTIENAFSIKWYWIETHHIDWDWAESERKNHEAFNAHTSADEFNERCKCSLFGCYWSHFFNGVFLSINFARRRTSFWIICETCEFTYAWDCFFFLLFSFNGEKCAAYTTKMHSK